MEARLTKQLLHIIELDRAGHLTPAIQHRLSEALDVFHREEQHRAAGGPTSMPFPHLLPVAKVGLAPYMAAGPKIPKTNFPKLPKPPKLPGVTA
jgi:hypothetical protein